MSEDNKKSYSDELFERYFSKWFEKSAEEEKEKAEAKKDSDDDDDFFDLDIPKIKKAAKFVSEVVLDEIEFGEERSGKTEIIPDPRSRARSAENAQIYPDFIDISSTAFLPDKNGKPKYTNPQEKNPYIKSCSLTNCPQIRAGYKHFKALSEKKGKNCPMEKSMFFRVLTGTDKKTENYYLYWRDNLIEGNFLPTDSVYLSLLFCEIAYGVFPLDPRETVKLLIKIKQYYDNCENPDVYYALDFDVENLIVSLCLIHNFAVYELFPDPMDISSVFYTPKAYGARGKIPYYEKRSHINNRELICGLFYSYPDAIYGYCGLYKCQNSKATRFLDSDKLVFFLRHIRESVTYAIKKLIQTDIRFRIDKNSKTRLVRVKLFDFGEFRFEDTPVAALNIYSNLRKLGESDLITNLQKYAENKVRAILGIQSRLKPNLSGENEAVGYIDEYFEPLMPKPKRKKRAEEEPEYLKKYDTVSAPLDISNARKIENDAWEIADRLSDAFEGEEENVSHETIEKAVSDEKTAVSRETIEKIGGFSEVENVSHETKEKNEIKSAFVRMLEGKRLEDIAKEKKTFADALAEAMNEAIYELVGDSVIENTPEGYRISEDYREDVKNFTDDTD